MSKILVINGPNLNMLGEREPDMYGRDSLDAIEEKMRAMVCSRDVDMSFFQSNHEGELVDRVQRAKQDGTTIILINPGAFTHTSVALRDAFLAVDIPFIELHLSNVYAREAFRHESYLRDIAVGAIVGFGVQSYELALTAALEYLARTSDR